jgi:predicted transcriptional regulator
VTDALTVPQQIEALLAEEPGLTMSKISARLGRNPGGIRNRLLQMTASGRVIAEPGPDGWTVYRLPEPGEGRRA